MTVEEHFQEKFLLKSTSNHNADADISQDYQESDCNSSEVAKNQSQGGYGINRRDDLGLMLLVYNLMID